MAEALLFGLATNVLASIASEIGKPAGSYASQNIQLLCCAKDELQSLEGTAEVIQAVLLDAEEKQRHSNEIKLWLQRLGDVLYEIDDLLDDVATKDRRQKVILGNQMSKTVRVFISKLNELPYRVKVACEIQKVRKRLDGFKKDKEFSIFEPGKREETTAIGRRKETETLAPDENIIGRAEDKKQIKRLLFHPSSSSQSVSYVAIVGKGGLGKTALARLVYNDGEVQQHFELKMWVCVSDVFDVNSIIKDILKSAKDKCNDEMKKMLQDLENKPMDQLPSLLRECLSKNKYLLVLDDLWNDDRNKWTKLGDWLKHGSPGSKILITTRSHGVTRATSVESVHDLRGLPEDISWGLFRKMAFGDEAESVDPDLENKGRDIVKKCGGVPLAIRHIGSLLYGKGKDVWLRFQKRELPEIREIDENNEGIMQVLKFSYDHLPSSLKHCFAYCSLYPKDYVYDKEEMIHQWIAQGFVELGDRDDKLEVANNYFSELLCRSFLDVEQRDDNDEVEYFKMHDLMHDLAQIVAGGECKIIQFDRGCDYRRIRHASFISKVSSEKEEKMASLLKNSKLRTFLYLKGESSVLNSDEVFSRCRRCRVLGLDDIEIPLPPSSFAKLKHLRFFNISRIHSIQSLPDSISDLVNLQFLKITECKELQTISGDWRKLDNLTFISIENCPSLRHLPPLSELPSLRTLILLFLECSLNFIQQTSEPQQSDTTSPFFPSLETLTLNYCGVTEWWEKQVMRASENHRLGNSQLSFPNLRSLVIIGCDDLNMVPSFPRVEYLDIDSMEYLKQQLMANPNCPSESTMESTPISFSQLKHLHLYNICKRGDMETSLVGTLLRLASNLKSMFLSLCDLRALSCAMRYLSSLDELHFQSCNGHEFTCREGYDIPWQLFAKLRALCFSDIEGLVALPEKIRHATTLQLLEIGYCDHLESLPEWIENFSLLKKIVLSQCPSLKRLAFNMHNLRSLKELRIRGCAALKKSCLPDDNEHNPVIVWEDS